MSDIKPLANPESVTPFDVGYDVIVAKRREAQIKEILGRGKIVRFTMQGTDLTKDVNEWNADSDEHGDLKAFRFSGAFTPYICWCQEAYLISELDS